ncbi:MAG: hypothetical protein E7510_00440 [Ruminococcus sp.]|nr:hypothetical protein [Ruminococcus sp.]
MNEVEFRKWMIQQNKNTKVISDCVSRLKRIEKELNYCDIDKEYYIDRCEKILITFSNMGKNEEMEKYHNTNLPIGKYYMNTYRLAIKQYIRFMDSMK